MMTPLSVFVVSHLLPVALLAGAGSYDQARGRGLDTSGPADRLFIAVFQLDDELDTLYQTEEKRVLAACKGSGAECVSKNLSPVRRQVGVLRSSPIATAPVIGNIHAVLKASGDPKKGLSFGLDVEWADRPGQFESWISNVGDYADGIHVAGVRSRGKWVQLSGRPFPTPAWLSIEGPTSTADVLTLEGEILRLEPLNARKPDRTTGPTTPGKFLILAVKGSEVEFREEVPSDFSCGKPVATPKVMPPTLRAPAAEFFNPDGSPRFAPAYTKGC